jgi:hypothetical protein
MIIPVVTRLSEFCNEFHLIGSLPATDSMIAETAWVPKCLLVSIVHSGMEVFYAADRAMLGSTCYSRGAELTKEDDPFGELA